MSRVIFRSQYASESRNLVFDFSSLLAVGETLSSASVGYVVYSGASSATLTLGASSIRGAQVTSLANAGTEGVTYAVMCDAVTSLGQIFALLGYLAIVPETV